MKIQPLGIMKQILPAIFLCILMFTSVNGFCQSKIHQSKTELKKEKTSTSSSSRSEERSSSKSNIGSAFAQGLFEIVGRAFLYVTYYSTIGNYKTEEHLYNKLSKYPYCNPSIGNYASADSVFGKNGFRFDFSNQYLFSTKDLSGNHFKASIRPFQYAYVKLGYITLSEYNPTIARNDHLSFVNASICYDRLRFEKFNLGWSVGLTYLRNTVQKGSINFGLNTDVFIAKPISLSATAQWASINQQPVNQLELKVNYHVKRYQFSVGYEHYKIASPDYHFLSAGVGVSL